MMKLFFISVLAANLWLAACTPRLEQISQVNATPNSQADLIAKGKKVFAQNCTACHNPNPKLDGAVGPAISGSSLELVTSRVLHATYPSGYKPKRPSSQMPALPSLEKDIPALYAFLNQ